MDTTGLLFNIKVDNAEIYGCYFIAYYLRLHRMGEGYNNIEKPLKIEIYNRFDNKVTEVTSSQVKVKKAYEADTKEDRTDEFGSVKDLFQLARESHVVD